MEQVVLSLCPCNREGHLSGGQAHRVGADDVALRAPASTAASTAWLKDADLGAAIDEIAPRLGVSWWYLCRCPGLGPNDGYDGQCDRCQSIAHPVTPSSTLS